MSSLEENNNNWWDNWFIPIIGIAVSIIGYVVYDIHVNTYLTTQTGNKVLLDTEYPYQILGILVIIFGIIIILIGLGKKIYSRF